MTDYLEQAPSTDGGFSERDGGGELSASRLEGEAAAQRRPLGAEALGQAGEQRPGPGQNSQMVALPQDEQDVQGYENIYKTLGRPDNPDDYGLNEMAAQNSWADPGFIGHMSSSMHQLGLNGRQAQGLLKAYQEAAAHYQAEVQQKQTAELQQLRAQLGGTFEARVDCARRAAQKFGLDRDALNALENAVGSAALIKHLSRIGQALGEEVRVDGQSGSPFGLSPAGARQKVDDLLNDRNFRERYLAGDKHALTKIAELLEVSAEHGHNY